MAEQKGPQFDGNEGGFIKLSDAIVWTANYRDSKNLEAFAEKKSFYVGERKVLQLLGQADAVGIRSYFAMDEKGNPQMAIVAVDKEGNDILRPNAGIATGDEAMVLDVVVWCPPVCQPPQLLGGN